MLITHDGYEIDDDPGRLDVGAIHAFLARDAYWSPGIPRDVLVRAIAGSLNFGLYRDGAQVGFGPLSDPERWMTIATPAEEPYRAARTTAG